MSYPAIINDNMVPSYNRGMPKFMAFLHLLLQPFEDERLLMESFSGSFSLESAVGAQLDILGALVGASRVLPFAPVSGSRVLGDADYRLLVRATVARNVWGGTNEQAAEILGNLFPEFGMVLEDHQDCSITIHITSIQAVSDLRLEMLVAGLLVPLPAGVSLDYEVPEAVEVAGVTIAAGVYTTGELQLLLQQ